MSPRLSAVLVACFLSGCARYADFTLPPVPGGDPSLVFRFTAEPNPVLTRGEYHDALNPSVDGHTNLYSVFDGRTWHTALATTEDGIHWTPRGIVLSPDPRTWEGSYIAANGTVLGGFYWYQAGPKERPRIGLARRQATWIKEPAPVLDYGPVGSFDEQALADPYVIRIGPYFYMYYLGQDRAVRQRIGLARSSDGVHWQKYRANPVLDLDTDTEAGLGEPAVWQSHGFYWMLYTVRNFDETRYLALTRSTDGVHWTRLPGKYSGTQPWNSKVICDPSVVVDNGTIKVWFGGGDAASPDENLHGQIGFATLVK
jgi:predicted GH43/DUF377 family glycosyl hydrolase